MLKDSSNRIHSSFNVIFHIDLMIKKINNRMKFISIEYCPIFSSLNYPGHHNGKKNHHIFYTDPRPPPLPRVHYSHLADKNNGTRSTSIRITTNILYTVISIS